MVVHYSILIIAAAMRALAFCQITLTTYYYIDVVVIIIMLTCSVFSCILGDRLKNGLPCAIGPLSVLSVLSICPVCDVGVLWAKGWADQDETWHASRPRPALATLC